MIVNLALWTPPRRVGARLRYGQIAPTAAGPSLAPAAAQIVHASAAPDRKPCTLLRATHLHDTVGGEVLDAGINLEGRLSLIRPTNMRDSPMRCTVSPERARPKSIARKPADGTVGHSVSRAEADLWKDLVRDWRAWSPMERLGAACFVAMLPLAIPAFLLAAGLPPVP
jgi:hypothetical protein